MKHDRIQNATAVSFGGWGWFLIIVCILYQMAYSAFAVDGINGYGLTLAAYLTEKSGTQTQAIC